MSLEIISKENKIRENQVQLKIFDYIDNNQSMIFNAGAGAGKTYALVESLKYIIDKYSDILEYHNQKIMCITFTNIAKDEINKRLGNSNIAKISTIHDRLWSIIKKFQKELVFIHHENLKEEINLLKNELDNNSKYKSYNSLSIEQRTELSEVLMRVEDIYWKNYSSNASKFRNDLEEYFTSFSDIMTNVGKFKGLASKIIKINKYKFALKMIDEKKEGYEAVKYNFKINDDRLHKMMISHDTLIKYSLKMIKEYDLLKKIVLDKYPYILIDEFQDTDEKVVNFMNELYLYAEKSNRRLFIGYYGDVAQNIYDNGVGERIFDIHYQFKTVNKIFNRRSRTEIINLINKIRNDDINQVSIFEDSSGGVVEFINANDDIDSYISDFNQKWNISVKNKLHCLVLTNKILAEYIGIKNIYFHFKETEYYSIKYDQVSTDLLSNNLEKLGVIPKIFFNVINFYQLVNDSSTLLKEIFRNKNNLILEYYKVVDFKNIISSLKGETLSYFLKNLFESYYENDNKYYKESIEDLFNIEKEYLSYEMFKQYLFRELYNEEYDNVTEALENIDNLLNIRFDEYIKWINYIKLDNSEKVEFHTYHGTKGAEYENVLIFMEDDFGREKGKFPKYFKNIDLCNDLSPKEKERFINTKNLLYVSCSRAINNLGIVYLDDISEFEESINYFFGNLIIK